MKINNLKKPSLAETHPEIAKQFHSTKNGDLKPENIHASARQKVWWLCSKNNSHEWESTVDNRNKGNGCPYCKHRAGKVNKGQSFGDLFKDLLIEWDFEKNKKSPYDYAPLSNKKVFWICKKNKQHYWEASIAHRVGGTGCPICNSGL